MPDSITRSWVEIDRSALRHNISVAKKLAQGAGIMAIVKANAYGHGAVETARALSEGADCFGVANVEEALELKAGGITTPLILLGPLLPEERVIAVREGFVSIISSLEEAHSIGSLGGEAHIAIDTGMGRAGVWKEALFAFLESVKHISGLRITGIATHLPSADEDQEFTENQLKEYAALADRVREMIPGIQVSHALNSAGLLRFPESAPDWVRAGLMLYGASPLPEFQKMLRPAMTWKTRVTLVRETGPGRSISYGRTHITQRQTHVATLPVGYADGYPRALSGKGAEVLINGLRCPVLGRVTMDQIMVDVGGINGACAGMEVVLMGSQAASEILVDELAVKAGTIAWEIFTGVQDRVKREFV